MKKLLIAALFGIFVTCCYGQDVKVNINNNDATATDDCAYRINGICSSEDIGGVDLEFVQERRSDCVEVYSNRNSSHHDAYANLTNYNSFPVTVIFKVKDIYVQNGTEKTFTVVLGVDGVKKVPIFERRMASEVTLEGMIVRKLAQ